MPQSADRRGATFAPRCQHAVEQVAAECMHLPLVRPHEPRGSPASHATRALHWLLVKHQRGSAGTAEIDQDAQPRASYTPTTCAQRFVYVPVAVHRRIDCTSLRPEFNATDTRLLPSQMRKSEANVGAGGFEKRGLRHALHGYPMRLAPPVSTAILVVSMFHLVLPGSELLRWKRGAKPPSLAGPYCRILTIYAGSTALLAGPVILLLLHAGAVHNSWNLPEFRCSNSLQRIDQNHQQHHLHPHTQMIEMPTKKALLAKCPGDNRNLCEISLAQTLKLERSRRRMTERLAA
mmetsp:Transcript_1421/g.2925  ORF Transcript_1421/g.2925 Transcript_1421/m.2925 type:complete len:291 (+) Transcript_1421:872-1744(+)